MATSLRSTSATTSNGGYDGEFVDEMASVAAWDYPFTPTELIAMAKRFYDPEVRYGLADGGECLAEDFEFCAAVVGPLGKEEYINALGNFNLEDSFDIQGNVYGFYADPVQAGRVWFFNRSVAKHINEFVGIKSTGKVLELPPQINFLDFNTEGKVKQYGFYTVDRRQGNTGGLGGAYGFFYGLGRPLPFPEAQPFKPSMRYRMFNFLVRILNKTFTRGKKEDKATTKE